jgi:hypothetical protein
VVKLSFVKEVASHLRGQRNNTVDIYSNSFSSIFSFGLFSVASSVSSHNHSLNESAS